MSKEQEDEDEDEDEEDIDNLVTLDYPEEEDKEDGSVGPTGEVWFLK